MAESAPAFLTELLAARSPSGFEAEAQAVFDRWVEPVASSYRRDPLGNRVATLNPDGDPVLLLSGHFDELGLQIRHVDDRGYLYFDTIGGHDRIMIPGRRVRVLARGGEVRGVTGKRAIHLLEPEERKKVPELHDMWIDIGAKDKADALSRVRIGDPVVNDHGFEILHGTIATARAFDNKVGAYTVGEVLRRLAAEPGDLAARIVSVATAQEEIGVRGATTSSYSAEPHFGIAVDVGHATDHPDADPRKFGSFKLGGGPILTRGANINPLVYDGLVAAADSLGMAYQVEADPRPTGTDGRAIQMARGGVATGVVSIPLRYMHTPSEMVDLNDVEATIQLLVAYARRLRRGDRGDW